MAAIHAAMVELLARATVVAIHVAKVELSARAIVVAAEVELLAPAIVRLAIRAMKSSLSKELELAATVTPIVIWQSVLKLNLNRDFMILERVESPTKPPGIPADARNTKDFLHDIVLSIWQKNKHWRCENRATSLVSLGLSFLVLASLGRSLEPVWLGLELLQRLAMELAQSPVMALSPHSIKVR